MKKVILFLWMILSMGCGSSSGTADPESKCVVPRRSISDCCLSNGGAKACAPTGQYEFDRGNRLVCTDGSVSSVCLYR